MNVIQIIPPTQISFTLPKDSHRTITLTNLTLHSVFIRILNSHPYELSLSEQSFFMQAFEERKVNLTLNWNQQSRNISVGKLRIFYSEVEEQIDLRQMVKGMDLCDTQTSFEDLTIFVNLDEKVGEFLNYRIVDKEEGIAYESNSVEVDKKYYLMQRISHNYLSGEEQKKLRSNYKLKNEILSYLQALPEVISIDPCQNGSFLIEFSQSKNESCEFAQFSISDQKYIYIVKRIVSYGQPSPIQTLLTIAENKEESITLKDISPREQKQTRKQHEGKQQKQKEPYTLESGAAYNAKEEVTQKTKASHLKSEQIKKALTKQSLIGSREVGKTKRRRNKSEEKIIEHQSAEEDEAELFKQQVRQLKLMAMEEKFEKREDHQNEQFYQKQQKIVEKELRIKQTNIEFAQKVLSVYVQEKEHGNQVYVILRDCVKCFLIEEPHAKKIIKFDAIYQQNVHMPCPVDKYKEQLIFGNQTILFWVNLLTSESEWKYVQRKYIYSLAVIEELSLVAVGGKNFSKLSYFGKETSRSNIKLYSCSSSDKHDHLFTYDMPGQNVGNIMNMAYVTAPPLGTKLLLVHSHTQTSGSVFHFLRVKAFNKIQVYGQVELEDIGILNLLKFKCNKESGRIVCMESLGETEMDSFKKLKLKCQYEKVQLSTEGLKFPLKQYSSFNLGGGKESKSKEWMSLVDKNGCLVHLYDFQLNHTANLQLGKGEILQLFSIRNGRYLLICAEEELRIHERIESE